MTRCGIILPDSKSIGIQAVPITPYMEVDILIGSDPFTNVAEGIKMRTFRTLGAWLLVTVAGLAVLDSAHAQENFRKVNTIAAQGGPNANLTIYQSSDDAIVEFRSQNNDTTPYVIEISMALDNMQSSIPLPFKGVLAPQTPGEIPLFRISRINTRDGFHYRNFNWRLTPSPLATDRPVVHNGVYAYPWPRGASFRVDNGFNGLGSHQGIWAYGVDFMMPVGSPVTAAREGTVIMVQTTYSQGGDDPSLGDKGNFIAIRHPDGSVGRYLHIRKDGALVRIGQAVRTGDLIAYSGNVGWSTAPHLHFDIVVPNKPSGQKTIPFVFRRPDGSQFEPTVGMRLTH